MSDTQEVINELREQVREQNLELMFLRRLVEGYIDHISDLVQRQNGWRAEIAALQVQNDRLRERAMPGAIGGRNRLRAPLSGGGFICDGFICEWV